MQKTISILVALTLLLVATMAYRIFGLESNVRTLSAQLDQQTMLINRALGKFVPLELPEDVEKEIALIEEQLLREANWPKRVDDAMELSERFASVVNKMPPWAQEELLPRLIPRRWDLEALILLSAVTNNDLGDLYTYLKGIEAHLSRKPDRASDELEKRLVDKKRDTELVLLKMERQTAIDSAKRALESRQGTETVLKELSIYEDAEVATLVRQLKTVAIIEGLNRDSQTLQNEIETYDKLSDLGLKEVVYARGKNVAIELRLRLSSAGISDSQVIKRLDELEQRLNEGYQKLVDAKITRDAERIRQYQIWALNEIKKVRAYKVLSEQELNKIPGSVDRINPLSTEHKAAIRKAQIQLKDDLVNYMAPINQSMLDEAVGTWFRKKYERAFNELGDEQIQTEVVFAFATAEKRPIEKSK